MSIEEKSRITVRRKGITDIPDDVLGEYQPPDNNSAESPLERSRAEERAREIPGDPPEGISGETDSKANP